MSEYNIISTETTPRSSPIWLRHTSKGKFRAYLEYGKLNTSYMAPYPPRPVDLPQYLPAYNFPAKLLDDDNSLPVSATSQSKTTRKFRTHRRSVRKASLPEETHVSEDRRFLVKEKRRKEQAIVAPFYLNQPMPTAELFLKAPLLDPPHVESLTCKSDWDGRNGLGAPSSRREGVGGYFGVAKTPDEDSVAECSVVASYVSETSDQTLVSVGSATWSTICSHFPSQCPLSKVFRSRERDFFLPRSYCNQSDPSSHWSPNIHCRCTYERGC